MRARALRLVQGTLVLKPTFAGKTSADLTQVSLSHTHTLSLSHTYTLSLYSEGRGCTVRASPSSTSHSCALGGPARRGKERRERDKRLRALGPPRPPIHQAISGYIGEGRSSTAPASPSSTSHSCAATRSPPGAGCGVQGVGFGVYGLGGGVHG